LCGYPESILIFNPDPAQEYRRRADACRVRASLLERRSSLIGNLRLAVFLLGAACAWAALSHARYLPLRSLTIPIAAFLALVLWHERVVEKQRTAEKTAAIYDRGLARIADRWVGTGPTGDRFRVTDHVFADDLDLFGRSSLFELLSTARTPIGEATLARWLMDPAPVDEIVERQAAVRELGGNLDLREDLAVCGAEITLPKDPIALLAWAEGPPVSVSGGIRIAAFALMLLAIAATVIGFDTGIWTPLIAAVAVEAALAWRWRKKIEAIVDPVSGAAGDLALVSELLARVEREEFQSVRLKALKNPSLRQNQAEGRGNHQSGQEPPSRALRKLKTLVNWADSRHNMLVRFLDILLLYSLQVAFAVERWRRERGRTVRHWLEAVGEMEALESLAAYAYEHPADPFPELVEREVPLFAGEELGHPLLPARTCVRNSVALSGSSPSFHSKSGSEKDGATDVPQVLLVSGSNMSGKSTFLRTIGVNAVLAQAGAPVRARSLRMTQLRLGAAIRVTDSLQAGRSGFYAEITRLRQIMDLTAGDRRVLFLADEMLHGTNSHDRKIGAEGLIRALVERGAIGVVTTHDLALTAVADGRVHNAHFQDELRDGNMIFDYRLHEGVVTKSNALELMRSVGLNV
jgi:hypothetical protein